MMRVVDGFRKLFSSDAKAKTANPTVVKPKPVEDPNLKLKELSLTVDGLRNAFAENKSKIVNQEKELEMAQIEFKTAFLEAKDVEQVKSIANHLEKSFNPDLKALNQVMQSATKDHEFFAMNEAAGIVADKLAAALLRIRIAVLKPDAAEVMTKLVQELEALAHVPDILPANFKEWIKAQKWLKDAQAYSEMFAVIDTIIADLNKVNSCIAAHTSAPPAVKRKSSTDATVGLALTQQPAASEVTPEATPQNTPAGSPRAVNAPVAANASVAGPLRITVGARRLSSTAGFDGSVRHPDTPHPESAPGPRRVLTSV